MLFAALDIAQRAGHRRLAIVGSSSRNRVDASKQAYCPVARPSVLPALPCRDAARIVLGNGEFG